jgi:GNAT superfamily N-acetyltransferase/ABC-type phosphate/phosphonate transport system substrate-binding protein
MASLPMYDLVELRNDTDRLWDVIASHLRADGVRSPQGLTRPDGSLVDHWSHPDLLMSQTCGYPLVRDLRSTVDVVGAFTTVADEPGFPGRYRSVMVGRRASEHDRPLEPAQRLLMAANGTDSLSGWISLGAFWRVEHTEAVPAVLITGSHAASLQAVSDGSADMASIDSWTYYLLSTNRPESVEGLVVLDRGPLVRVTPIITRHGGPVDALRSALAQASEHVGAPLGITGFVPGDRELYDPVIDLADDALSAFDSTLLIRAGRIDDYEYLGPIDLASNRLFVEAGHPEFETDQSISREVAERAVHDGRLIVAERYSLDGAGMASTERVGWVFISNRFPEMTIGQISVHPDWAKRGYGSALLAAVIRKARAVGESTIVLNTQDDVPWNRPWYEKFGFVVVPPSEWTPSMHTVTAEQTVDGLKWDTRVHMRLTL